MTINTHTMKITVILVNLSTTAVMNLVHVTITGNNFIYFMLLLLLFTLFITITQAQVVVIIIFN